MHAPVTGCEKLDRSDYRKSRGRPKKSWIEVIRHNLKILGLVEDMSQDRRLWQYRIKVADCRGRVYIFLLDLADCRNGVLCTLVLHEAILSPLVSSDIFSYKRFSESYLWVFWNQSVCE